MQLTPIFRYVSMISADGESNWYGGTLIYDQDKNSEVYKHYAELCQVTFELPYCEMKHVLILKVLQ